VPSGWVEDPKLGKWVVKQRQFKQRQFKQKLDRGEPSDGMTTARAAKLEALGFSAREEKNGIKRRSVS
jgi:hypothetical protein